MRQLGNCAPHANHATISTHRPATTSQDVQAIADLLHQSASADLEAIMRGLGRRHASTGAVEITPKDRKSLAYTEAVIPNPDLRITITTLQLLQ